MDFSKLKEAAELYRLKETIYSAQDAVNVAQLSILTSGRPDYLGLELSEFIVSTFTAREISEVLDFMSKKISEKKEELIKKAKAFESTE